MKRTNMPCKEELIERLKSNGVLSLEEIDGVEEGYVYTIAYLCEGDSATRSIYIIGGKDGYFRENVCGDRDRGDLTYAAEATLQDPDFGSFPGWIYNGSRSVRRSYFFSRDEAFPNELPGMYLVCRGKPYRPGDPIEYDVLDGFGATRTKF